MKSSKYLKRKNLKVNIMPRDRKIHLRFYKINYLPNLAYYGHSESPKKVFLKRILSFLSQNFENAYKYPFQRNFYQITALDVTTEYIFGKLWKLKKKKDKRFPWNGKDYEIKSEYRDDYLFNYFLISLKTNHLVIETKQFFTDLTSINVFEDWFNSFYKTKDSIRFQSVKRRTEFLRTLQNAMKSKKVIRTEFIVYPSNYDFDHLSKPLDKRLHDLKVSKQEVINHSNLGMIFSLNEPNEIASYLAQSLRGNGEPPKVITEDKKGYRDLITKKVKEYERIVEEADNLKEMAKQLATHLKEVIEDLGDDKP